MPVLDEEAGIFKSLLVSVLAPMSMKEEGGGRAMEGREEMEGNERKMSPTTENGCQQLLLNTILTLLLVCVLVVSFALSVTQDSVHSS